ncbi:ECF-type sigma factor [Pseudomarimonas arenosa]|uniref:Sigma-70 family RNA polymerase sigma factor n=1 Tax=Pseudomarimonas arenosa TaxID=2774145 RepID=A0AAW3ZGZ0_9GAMM|nr:ECF-type sigma factor [Pseudomarimonas arenosa]MBD8525083.1 sigma-70 family RNA polymerase sigma factor [Pseudomarimonas arenosa]
MQIDTQASNGVEQNASELTGLLAAWGAGDGQARERLIALVYPELNRLAQRQLQRERASTLRTGDLLHEACIRLLRSPPQACNDRRHFYAIAATVMRRVLVEHARNRAAIKRQAERVEEDELALPAPPDGFPDWLLLDQALGGLREVDDAACEAVELHLIAGLSLEECASLQQVSRATVVRSLRFGRAWLRDFLQQGEPEC